MSTAPLVEVKHIARYFDVSPPLLERLIYRRPKVFLRAVDDVSFSLNRGETLALVGESGCGKSTVARLLTGLYGLSKGSIKFDGQELSTMNEQQIKTMRRRLQMIFQDPYASLNPRWRVGRIIAEPLRTHSHLSKAEQEQRAAELLEQVGLSASDINRYPHQFSGGQRQRISIARALALRPEFIVCDEPTSALDVSVQAQVLNLMKKLQQDLGLSYLFISHNLAVIHHMADRVGVMYLGRIVEIAPRDDLFANPRHPYTKMLLGAIPDMTGTGKRRVQVAGEVPNPLNPPTGCTFHPRCPLANARCKEEVPRLSQFQGIEIACHAVEEGRE
ncbi:ABC transporter ATP-binding protein [Oligella urethralis]|uniref:ABC transporter ATP-binding protein n=1 Tax=Oligella urethralis TaxID=90245 RepID=UPI00037DADA4|nr:dipeptide ABC transporter ATP-binding protein [Oligella urethralis]SUA68499.1 Glutathione import ATP-binding protein GsiA [Oligella urethralis]